MSGKTALLLLCALGPALSPGPDNTSHPNAQPPAVRYYIAVRAELNGPDEVDIFGASNLPPGSRLTVSLYDFLGQGSRILNSETVAAVGANGLFRLQIHPKKGATFRTNEICGVVFFPTYPEQPENVLRAVGRTGERLGNAWENPQIDGNPRVKGLNTLTVIQ